jgi:hypothetical protein
MASQAIARSGAPLVARRGRQVSVGLLEAEALSVQRRRMRGGNRGQLSASADSELRIGVGEMDLYRVRRDEQALGDLRIGQALGGEVSDSLLALSETGPSRALGAGGCSARAECTQPLRRAWRPRPVLRRRWPQTPPSVPWAVSAASSVSAASAGNRIRPLSS